jgi:PAS domain S-box-containing protein
VHQAEQQVLHESIEAEVAEHLEALHQENAKYKQSQALLQKSEAKFRALGESAPDGIFLADRTGQWIYCNSPWTKMTGLSSAESMGRGWIRALHPEDKDKILQQWVQALRERKDLSQEFRLLTATGQVRWVSCRTAPAHYEPEETGETGGYAGSIKDITSYKEVEEALRRAKTDAEAAVKVKSEFLAKMSHEIRTPMNGVIGMTSLLSDTEMTSQQREYTDTIRRSAESLLLLINDVLDFSKVEARRLIFETIDFNLQETIEGSLELLAETAQAKNIELAGFVPTCPRSCVATRAACARCLSIWSATPSSSPNTGRSWSPSPIWPRRRRTWTCALRCAIPALAFRRKSSRACSRFSVKPTVPPRASTAAPAWAWPFPSS